MTLLRWDIFCRVIDNYGDAAVCGRLARQLAREHGRAVRLWIDRPDVLQTLQPDVRVHGPDDGGAGEPAAGEVRVCPWPEDGCAVGPLRADVVVEAFACELPADYLAAMAACRPAPVWIDLEYLSAEDWVTGCHGLGSAHPRLLLKRHMYFPGFGPATGGLLREAGTLAQADRLAVAGAARTHALAELGIEPAPGECLISLFAYSLPEAPAWLTGLCAGPRPVRLLVPAGRLVQELARALGQSLQVGHTLRRGRLSVQILPFLAQDDYDRLLALCDLNFVRGEDSFVRAQWAGRPLVWQIYVQEQAAHRPKLAAFASRYPPCTVSPAMAALWEAWNACASQPSVGEALSGVLAMLPRLDDAARDWRHRLAAEKDLATKLLLFCRQTVKC